MATYECSKCGMAVNATMLGWSSGISFIPKLMLLPFTTPTMDIAFAQEHVIPAIPALSLLFTPVMSAIGFVAIWIILLTCPDLWKPTRVHFEGRL